MRLITVGIIVVAVAACGRNDASVPDLGPRPEPVSQRQGRARTASPTAINPRLLRRFKPLEPVAGNTSDAQRMQVRIGKQLFFDKRLSLHRDTSCATCHQLDHGGTDRLATSRGDRGQHGTRNAPTVYNAALHIAQFWDGRANTIEEQAGMPMLEPSEMAMQNPQAVTAALRAVPGYVSEFAAAFPEDKAPTSFANAIAAIGAFERTLITPSRWDGYLRGDEAALSADEIEGMKVFSDVGCVQCHTGELIGGSMFKRVGLARPWPRQDDQGRFAITHDENDRMVFKVPSLRNVAVTAPYFHDGSTELLGDAVRMMANYQLDIEITSAEVDSIVAWLGTLTGVPSVDALTPPELPPG
jgi:cytochrome c peroxidase